VALPFVKMHGLGNDYVYIDGLSQPTPQHDWGSLAPIISDRHRGVGSDGLILIVPPDEPGAADARMIMFNADGSRGEMCGNGIRCVAKFVARSGRGRPAPDHAIRVRIQSDCGVSDVDVWDADAAVARARVDMGRPILNPSDIPVRVFGDRCVAHPLRVASADFRMTCVSMGNPHAVFFVDDLTAIDLPRLGPLIEHDPVFPRRVNVHVATARGADKVVMRSWERGAGLTQACGSGACAVVVAGVLERRTGRSVRVHLPGGELSIDWPADDATVQMTGPAEEVFHGVWPRP